MPPKHATRIAFTEPIPVDSTNDLRQHRRGQQTDARQADSRRRKRYRRRAANYEDRPFVGWDGEGVNPPEGGPQAYVLFGNSQGDVITSCDPEGLSTAACLDLMIKSAKKYPNAFNVAFAFNYDVNMILKDIPYTKRTRLYVSSVVRWKHYRLEWRRGKYFRVTDMSMEEGERVTCTIDDTFSFYQQSFVKACEEWLGASDTLARIKKGKDQRAVFTYDELETVILPYWREEIALFVTLTDALREALLEAEFKLSRWYGPGALANVVLKKYGVKSHMQPPNDLVREAAQYAYAGGRFELFKIGYYPGKVYSNDINSAYPYAIAKLPSLAHGHWEYKGGEEWVPAERWGKDNVREYGLYCLDLNYQTNGGWDAKNKPMPFFCRDKHDNIRYPNMVATWVWGVELLAAWDDWKDYIWISAAWTHTSTVYPFGWVEDLYRKRQQWKREGRGGQRALKLALNSIYGKMAQSVGWKRETGEPPTYHQFEWAGFITAYARSMLYTAMGQAGDSLIAVETDGIYTTRPLILDKGTGLGQWEEEVYDSVLYLQNGVYWLEQNGEIIGKSRGFDRPKTYEGMEADYRRTLELVAAMKPEEPDKLKMEVTRFQGFNPLTKRWREWYTQPREIDINGEGKRRHRPDACPQCRDGLSFTDAMHSMNVVVCDPRSHKRSLPWVDGERKSPWSEILAAEASEISQEFC